MFKISMSVCKRIKGSSFIKTAHLMLLTVKISDCPDVHNKHTTVSACAVFLILNLAELLILTGLQEADFLRASFVAFFT